MTNKNPKKKSRVWGATGLNPPVSFDFDKTNLINDIKSRYPNLEIPDSFFEKIEEAIRRCKGHIEVAQKSSPSSVRSNLSRLSKRYERLITAYNQLDDNSLQLITEAKETFVKKEARNRFFDLAETIGMGNYIAQQARILADEYPLRGNLQKHHINILAYETYLAVESELDVTPSQTKEGLFEQLLTGVLSLATNKERTAVHALTASCLKTIKTNDNGVITWKVPDS